MDLDLKDKKVFISGSTKGIGFETAKLFLAGRVYCNNKWKDQRRCRELLLIN